MEKTKRCKQKNDGHLTWIALCWWARAVLWGWSKKHPSKTLRASSTSTSSDLVWPGHWPSRLARLTYLHRVPITPLQGPHHRRHLRFAHSHQQSVQLALEKCVFHRRFQGELRFSLRNGMLHAGAGWKLRERTSHSRERTLGLVSAVDASSREPREDERDNEKRKTSGKRREELKSHAFF